MSGLPWAATKRIEPIISAIARVVVMGRRFLGAGWELPIARFDFINLVFLEGFVRVAKSDRLARDYRNRNLVTALLLLGISSCATYDFFSRFNAAEFMQ